MDSGGGRFAHQHSSAELFEGEHLSGQGKTRLCARSQLLFLSRGFGFLSDRGVSGGRREFQVQLFLLCDRHPDIFRRSSGALSLRLSLPLRLVSGAAAQVARKKAFDQEPAPLDLPQIRGAAPYGDDSPRVCGQ